MPSLVSPCRRRSGDRCIRATLNKQILGTLTTVLDVLTFAVAALLKITVSGLPVNTPWNYALGALLVSMLIGLVAGVVPAMRAARLNPVEALRDE